MKFNKKLTWLNYVNLGNSSRYHKSKLTRYEWHVPWSVKSVLRWSSSKNTLNIYVDNVFAKGLPYWKIEENGNNFYLEHLPWYKRVDLRFQINQEGIKHRYLTQFSGYCNLINFFNLFDGRFDAIPLYVWKNTRTVYYDNDWNRQAITLQPFRVVLGVRLGFRL